jgi:hypothetical protein
MFMGSLAGVDKERDGNEEGGIERKTQRQEVYERRCKVAAILCG